MSIKISLTKTREGIKLALEKCEEHLASAEILTTRDDLSNAAALIEFAIEEFGRAVALIEKLKTGSEEIDRKLFTSHDYKYEKAWTVLSSDLKTVYEGTFDVSAFNKAYFDVGKETISPRTRLDATYVNYDEKNQEWKVGIRADKEKLRSIINGIRESIKNLRW